MDKLCKYLIYQIAINVEVEDLLNFFLTNKKFSEISKDEYFWKLKKLKDYPNIDYPEDLGLTERYKFINTYNCGYAYDMNDKTGFPLDDRNVLVKKIYSCNNSYGYIYVLTHDYKLYRCGYFGYNNKHIPELLANNVYDFYCWYADDICFLDRNGNIIDSNIGYKEGNVKKFKFLYAKNYVIPENKIYYILTHDGNMYIQDKICLSDVNDFKMEHNMLYCLKYNKELWSMSIENDSISEIVIGKPTMIEKNVRKFKITEKDVFYLKYNKELWCQSKLKKMILENVTSFGFPNCYPVDYIFITNTNKDLFKLNCETYEIIQIDSNVDFVFQNDDLFYVKNKTDLFHFDSNDDVCYQINCINSKQIKYAILNGEISRDILIVKV